MEFSFDSSSFFFFFVAANERDKLTRMNKAMKNVHFIATTDADASGDGDVL